MSTKTVEAILSRAMSDPAFAEQLLADAEKALAGYDLTAAEIAQIKGMAPAEFASWNTEARKSFAVDSFRSQHNETALKA